MLKISTEKELKINLKKVVISVHIMNVLKVIMFYEGQSKHEHVTEKSKI